MISLNARPPVIISLDRDRGASFTSDRRNGSALFPPAAPQSTVPTDHLPFHHCHPVVDYGRRRTARPGLERSICPGRWHFCRERDLATARLWGFCQSLHPTLQTTSPRHPTSLSFRCAAACLLKTGDR